MICECHLTPSRLRCGAPNKCPECGTCWTCCSCVWSLNESAGQVEQELLDMIGQVSEGIDVLVDVATGLH